MNRQVAILWRFFVTGKNKAYLIRHLKCPMYFSEEAEPHQGL
jgi:hypothetical protein